MVRLYSLIFFFCLGMLCAWGQNKLSLYTKKTVSALQYAGSSRMQSGKTDAYLVGGKQYLQAFIYLDSDADPCILESYGVKIDISLPHFLTARLPFDRIYEIAELEGIKYIDVASPVYPMLDKARTISLVNEVHNGDELDKPFRGENVVIGIIDSGFEYGHPNFYSADKSEYRIKRVWDQNKEGNSPGKFNYGAEYTTKEEILEAQSDNKYTHGTHVVGIAAGADTLQGNNYYGVACDADIVLVSIGEDVGKNSVNVSNGISYIYDYATSVGKPCVVNISLGNHIGPHDGTSLFDQLTDALQGNGRILVGAAGNYGRTALHLSEEFKSGYDEPLKSFIKFYNTPSSALHGTSTVDVWGDKGMNFMIQAYVYDKTAGKIVEAFSEFDTSVESGNEEVRSVSVGGKGEISLSTEINPLNDKPHAMLTVDLTELDANYYIGFTVTPLSVGRVHAWADGIHSEFTSNNIKGWSTGENKYSIGEIGGSGKKIITVGAYVSRDSYTTLNSSDPISTGETLNRLASFSGRGPMADGRIKPDITAPGSYIVSSLSNYASSLLLAKKVLWNKKEYSYGYQQGTSMSAPFVTGVLATWLQANPELSPDDIRSVFKQTAIHDDMTGYIPENGNSTWGYGKIDAWNGIKKCIEMTSSSECLPETFPDITVVSDPEGGFRILFSEEYSDLTVSVYDINGRMIYHQPSTKVQVADELLVKPNTISKGIYIVNVLNEKTCVRKKITIQ